MNKGVLSLGNFEIGTDVFIEISGVEPNNDGSGIHYEEFYVTVDNKNYVLSSAGIDFEGTTPFGSSANFINYSFYECKYRDDFASIFIIYFRASSTNEYTISRYPTPLFFVK